jgi:hypothetical protein
MARRVGSASAANVVLSWSVVVVISAVAQPKG